ncbi:Methionyl-tRNA synthetase [Giardia lamblia P15]|uniref:Methionyl-tRNA synthetase n=1 Tax=Giardia intestinalis (strain P15) TaxID=658858 RepID=E1F1D8_GIAIA|nr:Methionyl-tRNA synthetase [Giardia lamblia P15]
MAESGPTGPLSSDILAVESLIDKLGTHLGEVSAPVAKKKGEGKKKGGAAPPVAELPPSVAAFEKCDIRVSQILTCTVPDYSEKLLVLTIDIGGGETREFAAGIAKYYTPEELVGKRIMTILNLKPRPMAGGAIISNAMLFCGSCGTGDEKELVKLCLPPQTAPPGTRIVPSGYTDKDPRSLVPAPSADPKKNFSRMTEHLTSKDNVVMLGDLVLVAGEYGPVSVEVPDGSHIG